MRRLVAAVLVLGCWLPCAHAQEAEEAPPAPDLDFLEYLGTWAEDDDEWLAIEAWANDDSAKPGEGSQESVEEEDDDDDGE